MARVSEDPTSRFAALAGLPDHSLPLDEGAIVIAAHARPGLDVAGELRRLDELADGVTVPTVDGVRAHLVEHLGFQGDQESYHDPRNSLLPEVLDRRIGIPLSLAIVAIEVGRRRGVPLVGVGMPGHFLVRSAADDGRYLDLFHGGAVLDRTGCREVFDRLHPGTRWEESFLDPVGAPSILTRMLTNLAGAYRRNGDRRSLCWALDLRLRLPGAGDRERRELAVVLGASGRYPEAAAALEGTGQERDARAALRLRARLN